MEIRNFNYSLDIQSASFFSFLKSLLENSRTKFNPIIPIILSFQRFLKILQNIISLSIVEEFKKIKGFFFSVCFRIDPPQRHLIYNPYTIHREKNKSSSYKIYIHIFIHYGGSLFRFKINRFPETTPLNSLLIFSRRSTHPPSPNSIRSKTSP